MLIGKLKEVPFIAHASYIEKDFMDEGIKKYLIDNEIKFLPAIIFSTNNINDTNNEMLPYLEKMNS
jgi:hypothetical protein